VLRRKLNLRGRYGSDVAKRSISFKLQQIEKDGIIGECSIDEKNKK
jgi:hypothetical protein